MFYYYFSSIISKLYFKSRRYYLTSSTCFYDKSNIIYCYLIEYLLVCEGHDRSFTQSILIYRYNSSKCFCFKVYCSPQSPSFFDLCLSSGNLFQRIHFWELSEISIIQNQNIFLLSIFASLLRLHNHDQKEYKELFQSYHVV